MAKSDGIESSRAFPTRKGLLGFSIGWALGHVRAVVASTIGWVKDLLDLGPIGPWDPLDLGWIQVILVGGQCNTPGSSALWRPLPAPPHVTYSTLGDLVSYWMIFQRKGIT